MNLIKSSDSIGRSQYTGNENGPLLYVHLCPKINKYCLECSTQ